MTVVTFHGMLDIFVLDNLFCKKTSQVLIHNFQNEQFFVLIGRVLTSQNAFVLTLVFTFLKLLHFYKAS